MERALAGRVAAARRVTRAPVSHGRGWPQGPLGTAVGGSRRGGARRRASALWSTHWERPRRPWQGRRRRERRRRREHQGPGRQTVPGRMQLTALKALPLGGWQSSCACCVLSACACGRHWRRWRRGGWRRHTQGLCPQRQLAGRRGRRHELREPRWPRCRRGAHARWGMRGHGRPEVPRRRQLRL